MVEAKSNNGTQKWKWESEWWVVEVAEKQLLNYGVQETVEVATTDEAFVSKRFVEKQVECRV